MYTHSGRKPTKQISKYKVLRCLHKVQVAHYVNPVYHECDLSGTTTDIGLWALCYVRLKYGALIHRNIIRMRLQQQRICKYTSTHSYYFAVWVHLLSGEILCTTRLFCGNMYIRRKYPPQEIKVTRRVLKGTTFHM